MGLWKERYKDYVDLGELFEKCDNKSHGPYYILQGFV